MDIVRGHVYRAKRPKPVGFSEVFDDRQVLYVTDTKVQYDSPTVRDGRKYPTIDHAKFTKWVGEDVTEGYPDGWAQWPVRVKQ